MMGTQGVWLARHAARTWIWLGYIPFFFVCVFLYWRLTRVTRGISIHELYYLPLSPSLSLFGLSDSASASSKHSLA